MDADGLKEFFEPFGAVAVKRLFSGHGVYRDGLCFAIHIRGEIYLKSDAQIEATYRALGSEPFVYGRQTRKISLGFWRLMPEAYDDGDELRRLSALALGAADRFAAKKAAKIRSSKPLSKAPPRVGRERIKRSKK